MTTIQPHPTWTAIIAAPLPEPTGINARAVSRKEFAAALRALLRKMQIKSVSVTAPNYSMAQSIDVELPTVEHWTPEHPPTRPECPVCSVHNEARSKMQAIILAAFSGAENRSDYQTDYFDFRFSVA